LNLPGLIFLTLMGVGVFQLATGRRVIPPWYTAFWYAFGVFSRLLVKNNNKEKVSSSMKEESIPEPVPAS
jgi:hypothetical protein